MNGNMTSLSQKPRLYTVMARFSTLALMFWAAVTWTTGYIFAPMIFAKWPKIEAGLITGELLRTTYQISLICAMVLLIDYRIRFRQKLLHTKSLWLMLVAVFIVVIQFAVITPKMQLLKATMLNNAADSSQFMQLHGVSQVLYLITSLILAVLVWGRLKDFQDR